LVLPFQSVEEAITPNMTMPTAVLNGRAHDVGLAADDVDSGARPGRRNFTAEYKLAILAEYDTAEADGSNGSILRREGSHASHIVEWRRARDAGALVAMHAASPRRAKCAAAKGELERLRCRNLRLDDTGRLHELMEVLSERAGIDWKPTR
jgi:transposase